eukprot:Rmarinus@m.18873
MPPEATMEATLKQGLECAVCYIMFDEKEHTPTALPCQHTFCASCIVKLLDSNNASCPMCCQAVNISKVEELKKNYAVLNFVRVFNQWMAREGPSESSIPTFCTECATRGEMPAESYCGACSLMLCRLHVNLHKELPWTSNHVLVDVSAVRVEDRRRLHESGHAGMKNVLVCGRHSQERLRYYCPDCDELICLDCYNIYHKRHEVLEIDESLAEDRKKRLDELRAPLREMFCNRESTNGKAAQRKGPAFDIEYSLRMIDAAADEVIKEVESQRAFLKDLIRKEAAAGVKVAKTHQHHLDIICASAESLCLRWEKARDTLTHAEVLMAYPGLLFQMEQLLGQPLTARAARPLVSLAVPALHGFAHTTMHSSSETERRLYPVSTSAALPEDKGDAVALAYDAFRDAVWVATTDRWVGCFLIGNRTWLGEWFQLKAVESSDSDAKRVHDFVVMANGLIYVVPQTKTSVEVYDRRGLRRPVCVSLFEQGASNRPKLQGLSCSGDDLVVACEDRSVYVVSQKDPGAEAAAVRVFDGSSLEGRLDHAHVAEDGMSIMFTLVKDSAVDVLKVPVGLRGGEGASSSSSPSGSSEVVKTLPKQREGAIAWDAASAVSWSQREVLLHYDEAETRVSLPDPVLGVAGNPRREVFVLCKGGLTVLDDATVSLPHVASSGPAPLAAGRLAARRVDKVAFDPAGTLWLLTDTGDVVEYNQAKDVVVERFQCAVPVPPSVTDVPATSHTHQNLVCTQRSVDGDGTSTIVYVASTCVVLRYEADKFSLTEVADAALPKGCFAAMIPTRGVPVWHVPGETVLHLGEDTCPVGFAVTSLSVSSDGASVLVGGTGQVAIFDTCSEVSPAKKAEFSLPCADVAVTDMATHTHDKQVVVATASGMLWLYNLSTSKVVARAPAVLPGLTCVAVNGAEGLVAAAGGTHVRFFRSNDWLKVKPEEPGRSFVDEHLKSCSNATCKKKGSAPINELFTLANSGALDCVKCVSIATAGKLTYKKHNNDQTVIHSAASSGKLPVIRYLVEERGATELVTAKDKNDWTVLHYAAANGYLDVVRYFVEERGAAALINEKTKSNQTALVLAKNNGKTNLAEYLLGKGAL